MIVQLKNLTTVITKGTTPSTIGEPFTNSGINFIKSESITENKNLDNTIYEHINKQTHEKMFRSQLQKNDILISIAGAYLGKVAMVREIDLPANTNQAVGIIRLDEKKVNPEYIYYYLSSNFMNSYINKLSAQSSQPNLNLDLLGKLPINIVNRGVQDKIVNILASIDIQITRNNDMVQKLQDLTISTYSRWFNQFEFLNKDGLPYKSYGGEFVYNEELKRNIPIDWKVKELGDILKESDKSQIQVGDAKQNIGTYPFFTSGEEIILYKDYFVNGAYCYLNTGGNADVKFFDGKASYSTDTWCISFNEYTYIMNEYLQSIKPLMDKLFFSGSGLKHLQKEVFKKQKILIPPQNIVFKYNDIFDDCHKQISKIYMQNIELNNLKTKLLPLLINGQLEV